MRKYTRTNTSLPLMVLSVFSLMVFFLLANLSYAQSPDSSSVAPSLSQEKGELLVPPNWVLDSTLYPSKDDRLIFEVHEVLFKGNSNFTAAELLNIIASKPSERGFIHKFLQFYYDRMLTIPAAPPMMLASMKAILNTMLPEIRYFNQMKAESDAELLARYYKINGFQDARASYTFLGDPEDRKNRLIFNIYEGNEYKIKSITYSGLDSIPAEVMNEVKKVTLLRPGDKFAESRVMTEINEVYSTLHNNGYFFSYYKNPPLVYMDTVKKTDSIFITFVTGKRQKISEIVLVDSTFGQPGVSTKMKLKQIEFQPGDWYSQEKIKRSEDNLLTLGTFFSVIIDTTAGTLPRTDSTLAILVYTQYRKLQEWSLGLFVDRTSIENIYNGGAELSFIFRNFGGGAQAFNPYVRGVVKDLSRSLRMPFNRWVKDWDYEGQVGFKFGQPLLWTIENSRIGLFVNPLISYRELTLNFKLLTFSFPTRLTVRFPSIAYFNTMLIDFNFEYQRPIDFGKVFSISSHNNSDTANYIRQALVLYQNLDEYVNKSQSKPWLTANIVGLSIIGDHRNNLFAPTSGDYATISVDGWNFFLPEPKIAGIAKYVRAQFAYYYFTSMNPRTVFAFKARLGTISLFDQKNSYVPIERQFFAGGANSVRGWPSRELRYTQLDTGALGGASNYKFFQDFVGNSGIIEGTAEMRYRIVASRNLGGFWKEQIDKMSLVFFVDAGNAFNWFADDVTKPKPLDYITKLAVATGFGIRFDLPVGPLRLDFGWPVYDPNPVKVPPHMQVHIGLGHSF